MKRTALARLLPALLLALLALALASCSKKNIVWSGKSTSWMNEEYVESDVSVDLEAIRGLDGEWTITGTITVDGKTYADIADQKWFEEKNLFVPLSLKEDIGGRRTEIYDDYVRADMDGTGQYLSLVHHPKNTEKNRIYDIVLK